MKYVYKLEVGKKYHDLYKWDRINRLWEPHGYVQTSDSDGEDEALYEAERELLWEFENRDTLYLGVVLSVKPSLTTRGEYFFTVEAWEVNDYLQEISNEYHQDLGIYPCDLYSL